jgi:hypothetical protein
MHSNGFNFDYLKHGGKHFLEEKGKSRNSASTLLVAGRSEYVRSLRSSPTTKYGKYLEVSLACVLSFCWCQNYNTMVITHSLKVYQRIAASGKGFINQN